MSLGDSILWHNNLACRNCQPLSTSCSPQ